MYDLKRAYKKWGKPNSARAPLCTPRSEHGQEADPCANLQYPTVGADRLRDRGPSGDRQSCHNFDPSPTSQARPPPAPTPEIRHFDHTTRFLNQENQDFIIECGNNNKLFKKNALPNAKKLSNTNFLGQSGIYLKLCKCISPTTFNHNFSGQIVRAIDTWPCSCLADVCVLRQYPERSDKWEKHIQACNPWEEVSSLLMPVSRKSIQRSKRNSGVGHKINATPPYTNTKYINKKVNK